MVSYWLQCASTLKLWPTRDNTFAYFRLEFDHHHALFTEFLWKDEKLRTAPDLFTVGKLSRLCPSQFILGLFGEQHCSRLNCKQTLPFHLFHLLHTIWHVETHPCLESSDGTARWVKLVDWMGRERPLPVQSVQSAWRAAQEALGRETTPCPICPSCWTTPVSTCLRFVSIGTDCASIGLMSFDHGFKVG